MQLAAACGRRLTCVEAGFNKNLSEYGFVLQNFWNNANQHVVPDPFGIVK